MVRGASRFKSPEYVHFLSEKTRNVRKSKKIKNKNIIIIIIIIIIINKKLVGSKSRKTGLYPGYRGLSEVTLNDGSCVKIARDAKNGRRIENKPPFEYV